VKCIGVACHANIKENCDRKIARRDKRIDDREKSTKMKQSIFMLIGLFLFQSCSMDKFVIRQTGALLDYGVLALYEETDLKLAEQAMASDIKLLEGMIKGDPENEHLLLLTAQALAGYALGFAEDEEPERAKVFYLRAKEYGMRVLLQNDEFAKADTGSFDDYTVAVNDLDEDDIDALFWTGFAWAAWINLSIDNPRAMIDLTKVQILMDRVLQLDETYFHGSTHLYFGSIWGLKPRMLGGDPEKAKEHFDRNLEITDGKFLLTYVYYARFYAAKVLDEDLYNSFIVKIEETPADVLPGYQLMNMIAKKKVKYLKEFGEEWF